MLCYEQNLQMYKQYLKANFNAVQLTMDAITCHDVVVQLPLDAITCHEVACNFQWTPLLVTLLHAITRLISQL